MTSVHPVIAAYLRFCSVKVTHHGFSATKSTASSLEAAARAGPPPNPYSFRIRVAAHRALFACVPGGAARGAVRAYHRIRRDGL